MRPETALRSRNRSVELNSDLNKEALEKARKKLEQDINKFLYQKVHSLSRSLLWSFANYLYSWSVRRGNVKILADVKYKVEQELGQRLRQPDTKTF